MLRARLVGLSLVTAAAAVFSCSSSGTTTPAEPTAGAGGTTATGGSSGTGGTTATGGSAGTGGAVTGGSAGTTTAGAGGATAGAGGTGGATGGSAGTGGAVTGGSAGTTTAGAGGTGGAAGTDAGATGDAGPSGVSTDGSTKPAVIDGGGGERFFPPTVPVSAPTPIGPQTGPRKITFENRCTFPVWMFGDVVTDKSLVPVKIESGQALAGTWPDTTGTGLRLWGRTNCVKNANWDCDEPYGSAYDTLVEWNLAPAGKGEDYYDISMVDGYTLPVAFLQMTAPFTLSSSYYPGADLAKTGVQQCGSPVCAADLLTGCPASQQMKNKVGKVVGCKNGQSANGGKSPTPVTLFLKNGCPTTYTFPYDDFTSLFKCGSGGGQARDYKVIWCPTEGPVPGFPQYPLQ